MEALHVLYCRILSSQFQDIIWNLTWCQRVENCFYVYTIQTVSKSETTIHLYMLQAECQKYRTSLFIRSECPGIFPFTPFQYLNMSILKQAKLPFPEPTLAAVDFFQYIYFLNTSFNTSSCQKDVRLSQRCLRCNYQIISEKSYYSNDYSSMLPEHRGRATAGREKIA